MTVPTTPATDPRDPDYWAAEPAQLLEWLHELEPGYETTTEPLDGTVGPATAAAVWDLGGGWGVAAHREYFYIGEPGNQIRADRTEALLLARTVLSALRYTRGPDFGEGEPEAQPDAEASHLFTELPTGAGSTARRATCDTTPAEPVEPAEPSDWKGPEAWVGCEACLAAGWGLTGNWFPVAELDRKWPSAEQIHAGSAVPAAEYSAHEEYTCMEHDLPLDVELTLDELTCWGRAYTDLRDAANSQNQPMSTVWNTFYTWAREQDLLGDPQQEVGRFLRHLEAQAQEHEQAARSQQIAVRRAAVVQDLAAWVGDYCDANPSCRVGASPVPAAQREQTLASVLLKSDPEPHSGILISITQADQTEFTINLGAASKAAISNNAAAELHQLTLPVDYLPQDWAAAQHWLDEAVQLLLEQKRATDDLG